MELQSLRMHGIEGTPGLAPTMHLQECEQLAAKLVLDSSGRFSTIVAGPGWGKTTALARFAEAQPVPVAWYQVRAADSNVAAFAQQLVESIAAELPGFGADFGERLAQMPAPTENWTVVARAIARESAETIAGPFMLVLDDYHLVAADEPINLLLAALIELLPAHAHVLVASRQELPATLARSWTGGGGSRVTEDDLRFSEPEGIAYLRTLMNGGIPAATLGRFTRELEGWPLGLALLGEHLRSHPEAERLPADVPGLFDYLSEEALQREAEEMQQLLLAAAIPERFGPALMRHVLEREVAATMDELARRHLFVIRLDGGGAVAGNSVEWYRFHHLYRTYLHWKLDRELPAGAQRDLELRVADAWHALGEEWEAVKHELAAADYDRAARTLLGLAPQMIASGQAATLRASLERLPAAVMRDQPSLLLHQATCLFGEGQVDVCRQTAARALHAARMTDNQAAHVGAVELTIRSYTRDDSRDGCLGCVGFFYTERDSLPPGHPLAVVATADAACAMALVNRFAEAEELFRWKVSICQRSLRDCAPSMSSSRWERWTLDGAAQGCKHFSSSS